MIDFQEFARSLAGCESLEEALALFLEAIRELGFHSYDYGFGTSKIPEPRSALDLNFQFMKASIDWEKRYLTCGYMAVDRLTPLMLSRTVPLLYTSVLWTAPASPLQSQMEDDLHQKRIFSGLSIPMHMSGGRFAILNLGSSLSPEEFARSDADTRPVVSLIAHILHDHVARRFWPQTDPGLTARDSETQHWAAQGKTAWETGEILCIAERTVKKHTAAAGLRLGVTTRTQAVARAVARGLIVP